MWVSALGPTVFDLVEDRVEILLATHPLDHPGPEGAVAHLARHLVGGVEPEDVGAIDQISDRRQRLVGVQALVECNVRGDPSAGLSRIGAELGRCDRLEHLRRSLVLRVEHGHEVASTEDRLTLVATLVRRQDEHFGVRGEVGLDVIGEEGRDEVALPVQEAARRVGPQTVVSHVEGVRGDGLLAAVHGAIHEQKLGDGLAGLLHDRVVERDLVADPLVVDLRTTDAEDVLLHPVRARPADVDTEAPGSGAVSLDLVGQRHELLVGCGRDVAGVLELGRRIPHEALAVDRVREAVHDVVHRGGVDDSRHSGVRRGGDVDAAVPGIIDTATVDDVVYGLPYSINGKSLVWYPSPEFEDAGYVPATTHQELVALSDQIKADGTAPWCFGVDVGWPARPSPSFCSWMAPCTAASRPSPRTPSTWLTTVCGPTRRAASCTGRATSSRPSSPMTSRPTSPRTPKCSSCRRTRVAMRVSRSSVEATSWPCSTRRTRLRRRCSRRSHRPSSAPIRLRPALGSPRTLHSTRACTPTRRWRRSLI